MDLDITVLESGTLESASRFDVLSTVEGQVAIIGLVPDGSAVRKGDVVVELESSPLKTRRTEQQIVVEKARAAASQAAQQVAVARSQAESDIKSAELTVEFSQLDLRKYEEGDYPQELRALQTELALAEEELERARVQLEYSQELKRDGYISDSELGADQSRATRAQWSVDLARNKEVLLREFTFPRTKRDLESKVAEANRALSRARSVATASVDQAETGLRAQEATLGLEESKLTHIEQQLERCLMHAPQDGIVLYPVPPDTDLVELFIKAGTMIRERQHVFSISNADVLQVSTAVHEAMVNQVKLKMPARIWIDVYPDLELRGEVTRIAPLPQPEDWRRSTVKFYETTVKILDPAPGLRPGMSARVEIQIDHLSSVLGVPVQTVVQRGQSGFCYVMEGGRPVLRRLRLGRSNENHLEVLEGLTIADRLVLRPDAIGIADNVLRAVAPEELLAPVVAAAGPVAVLSPVEESSRPAAQESADDTALDDTQPPAPDIATEPAVPAPVLVQKTEFKAALVGATGAVGEAEYEIQVTGPVTERKFSVDVLHGSPGATWEVTVDGVVVGRVTLDESGACAIKWKSKHGAFPPNFPEGAGSGAVVTVGPELSGTLEAEPPDTAVP
jgi:HlyD family secretion protein